LINLDAYMARLGRPEPTLPAVVAAHAAHLPFENLDPLRGVTPRLDLEGLEAKLVHGGRGGYCFEHNLLLAHALEALGFQVRYLAARVLWNQPEGAIMPRSHMLLLVDGERIVDVGFGGLTLTGVLRLDAEGAQPTPHEPFRIVHEGEDRYLEAEVRGAWQRLYRFDLQRQYQVDYEVSNHYLCTHPRSHFRAGVMAARSDRDARYALRNGKLSIHRSTGSEQRDLAGVAEIKEVLRELFHVDVPVDEALDAALARVLAQ
jgi:N-hydroxyarylamine O-acetyltransferase